MICPKCGHQIKPDRDCIPFTSEVVSRSALHAYAVLGNVSLGDDPNPINSTGTVKRGGL